MIQQFNLTFDQLILLVFLMILAVIIWGFITAGTESKAQKRPKNLSRYFYRKKLREKQNKEAAKHWKSKTNSQRDPGMISNEPLDFEKAGNLKYHDYVQAQWDELKKG